MHKLCTELTLKSIIVLWWPLASQGSNAYLKRWQGFPDDLRKQIANVTPAVESFDTSEKGCGQIFQYHMYVEKHTAPQNP